VQCLDDKIYKKINRGHKIKEVIEATKMLKEAGFKIGYHMMLGLPFSNPRKDLQMFKKLFSNQNFKPDQIKIYPCQVIRGAKLEQLYKQKKYKPYTKSQLEIIITKILRLIPNYCRVMRIMREIPPEFLVAGTTRIDLRRDLEQEIRNKKLKIKEIRMREIGFNIRDLKPGKKINQQLKLKTTEYNASSGREYFLEFVNKDNILFGLARLRISNNKAIIRELHVYGKSLEIGEKSKSNITSQHKGLGKLLMKKAEEISRKSGVKRVYVISGVGVREYYKKLGYKVDGYYVSKKF
jgi:elongator complex protein 3